jgi:hypothetical protein
LKQIAFFAVVGLAVIAGIVLRFGQFFGQSEAEQNAPATVAAPAPPPPVAATPPAAAPTPPTAAPTPPVQTTESQAKTPPPAQEPATPNELAGQPGEAAQQADQASQPVDDADSPGRLGRVQSWFPDSRSPCWRVHPLPHRPCMAFRLAGRSA